MAATQVLHRRLTSEQVTTLATIAAFHRENGFAPTVRDVQEALGLAAPSSAFERLNTLRRYGLVDWRDGQVRTLHLTEAGHAAL